MHIFQKLTIVILLYFTASIAQANELVLQRVSITSKVLSEERDIAVQLPESYFKNTEQSYPLILRLDGAGNIPRESAMLKTLYESGAAPEVIIVAIENTNRLRDLAPYVNEDPRGPVGEGGGADEFLQFIETELLPFLNKEYRTGDFKVIAGASVAGLFTLHTLRTKPDLFNAHIAYSPAVWWGENKTAKNLKAFMSATKELNSYLYMNIGSEHIEMRKVYDDMLTDIEQNKPKNFHLTTDFFPKVPHGLTSSAGLFNAYHNLFLPLVMPNSELKGGVSSIKNYYNRVSEQRGRVVNAEEWVMRELGYYLVRNKDFANAIEVFKYNIDLYPGMASAYNGLAYAYEQNKQFAESLKQVNTSLKLSKKGDDGYDIYVNRKQRLIEQLEQNNP
jgi:predicted alpha/beta superfamily hydrolase